MAIAASLLGAFPKQADAALMLAPGTTLPGEAYKTYGAQFADSVVAIKTISPTSGTVRYASGVQLDEYTVITAAHVLDSTSGFRPFANVSVLGGVNFFSPDFESSIASFVIHPTFVQGSGPLFGNQLDLAVITLSSPIYGRGVEIGVDAPVGAVVSMAGFGQHGLSGQNPLSSSDLEPQDGYIRAFESQIVTTSAVQDNRYYGRGIGFSSLNLEGMGAQFDSGGGVFYNNKLIGFITSGGGSASTNFFKVTSPEALGFIGTAIPEPSRAVLIFGGLLAMASRRRRM